MNTKTLVGILILSMALLAQVKAQFGYIDNGDRTCAITNCTCTNTVVIIPTNINGLSVSSIVGTFIPLSGNSLYIKSAFAACSNLTSVTIPDTVTSIGDGAFDKCTNLTGVTIPDSVTNIGCWAFSGCYSLASVKIPDSVASIGKNAFSDCISLNSVRIPNSVSSIGNWAFAECHSLTNAIVGNGIIRLGYHDFGFGLFHHCANLQAVCFKGNAPSIDSSGSAARVVFGNNTIVYYLPDTRGWGPTFGGRPTKVWEPYQ